MKNDTTYLEHILTATQSIEQYLKGVKSYNDFKDNKMLIDACIRELEIIGEAANNVSEKFRRDNPKIPWHKMIGIRNILIHEYFGVNKKIIWQTCQKNIKDLKQIILLVLK